MRKLRKADLVTRMAVRGGWSLAFARLVHDGMVDVFREALLGGRSVSLVGFGRFDVRVLQGCAWDPIHGVRVAREPKRRVWFKGRSL